MLLCRALLCPLAGPPFDVLIHVDSGLGPEQPCLQSLLGAASEYHQRKVLPMFRKSGETEAFSLEVVYRSCRITSTENQTNPYCSAFQVRQASLVFCLRGCLI